MKGDSCTGAAKDKSTANRFIFFIAIKRRSTMTAEELREIYYINREIKALYEELAILKQQSFIKSITITDMPTGGEQKDMLLEYVSSVILIEDMIKVKLKELQYKRKKIYEYLKDANKKIRRCWVSF